MRKPLIITLLGLAMAGVSVTAAQPDLSKLPPASDKKALTYEKDIKPMLEASCTRCHGAEKPKGGLRLDNLEGVLQGGKDGKVITPGKSEKSLLVIAAARIDPESAMPPTPKPGRGGPGGMRPGGPGGGNPGGPPPANPGGGQGGNRGGGPGGPGGFGPPPKPLTPEQVGVIRAWVDQGAK